METACVVDSATGHAPAPCSLLHLPACPPVCPAAWLPEQDVLVVVRVLKWILNDLLHVYPGQGGRGKGCTSWQLILTVQILQLQAPYIFVHRRVNLLWWYTCSSSNSCCIFTLSVFLVPWLIRCARINYIYSNLPFWATTRSLLTKELPFSLSHPFRLLIKSVLFASYIHKFSN